MPYATTLTLKGGSGYTATAIFRHGVLRAAAAALDNGGDSLGSACQVDDQTDAVEPFEVELTNTTAKFAATPAIQFTIDQPSAQNTDVSAEAAYSSGSQCTNLNQNYVNENGGEWISFAPGGPLQAGQSSTTYGFVILPGYFSPSSPNGDPALAQNLIIQFGVGQSPQGFSIVSGSNLLPNVPEDAIPLQPGTTSCLVAAKCS